MGYNLCGFPGMTKEEAQHEKSLNDSKCPDLCHRGARNELVPAGQAGQVNTDPVIVPEENENPNGVDDGLINHIDKKPKPNPPDEPDDMSNLDETMKDYLPGLGGGENTTQTNKDDGYYNTRDGRCKRWTCQEKCEYKKNNPMKRCYYPRRRYYKRTYKPYYRRYYNKKSSTCGCACKK